MTIQEQLDALPDKPKLRRDSLNSTAEYWLNKCEFYQTRLALAVEIIDKYSSCKCLSSPCILVAALPRLKEGVQP